VAQWQSDQVLAWTEREGPARPLPPPSRLAWLAMAGTVGVAFVAMLTGPDLCPDHRAWVHAISAVAFIGTVVAVVGLLRGWAVAPAVTVVSAACGIAIGFVDSVHDPARGAFITVAFATVTVIATIMAVFQLRAARWDAQVAEGTATSPVLEPDARASAPAPEVEPVPEKEGSPARTA
jgi:hypothetical protein